MKIELAKGGRVAAGVLGIIGAGIYLFMSFMFFMLGISSPANYLLNFLLSLVIGTLGLVGAILLLVDKTAGGILAAISGTISIVLVFYWIPTLGVPIFVVAFLLIPPGLLLTSGILGLIVGSEF